MAARSYCKPGPSRFLDVIPPAEDAGAGGVVASAAGAAVAAAAASGGAGLFWGGAVLLSCLLAFLVNLSTFLVIGRTSPVSYQVMEFCSCAEG